MRNILSLILLLVGATMSAQELNCVVTINSERVDNTNQQIFKTLQKSVAEFVNKTKWTDQPYKQGERIECSMFINVSAYSNEQFSATIQVQASRPVFNSTYSSPILNFNDKDFSFKYQEFENLLYNPNTFESNLVSVLSYYCFIILGMDADTFSPMGGSDYFATAQEIVNLAQQTSYKGWSQTDGNQNRYFLVADLISPTFTPLREASYQYHRNGLDKMADDPKAAKAAVKDALLSIQPVYAMRSNAFLTRVFFDAKADEIQQVFSGGPQVDIAELINQLNKFSPINAARWSGLK